MYAKVDPLSNKIRIISDTPVSKTQLDVYHQDVLLGYFNTAGTGTFTKPLLFASTATNEGTKYIFTIDPDDIGMTDYFDDYLYHFILSNAGSSADELFGVIVSRGIDCCMEKALKAALEQCSGCDAVTSTENQLDIIATVKAYLDGGRAAIRAKQKTTALCAMKVIDSFCSDCGCYGS